MSTVVPGDGKGLAIVGDGSAVGGDTAMDPSEVLTALQADVRLLRAYGHLTVFPVAVTVRDASQLSAALRSLPAETTAIFLARTEPSRAHSAQQDLASTSTIPVITQQDTTGMALTAALLTTLRRMGTDPQASRVVVARARVLPMLVPLLIAAGVGDISSWNESDAPAFPLARTTWDTTAVIDLLGAASTLTPESGNDVPVLAPDPIGHLLALPGLLRALHDTPTIGWGVDPLHHLDVHYACAQALAALTPVDRTVPDLADPDLTDSVARAATKALRPPRTFTGNP